MPMPSRPSASLSFEETLLKPKKKISRNRNGKKLEKQIKTIYEGAGPFSLSPPSNRKIKFLIWLVMILAFLSAASWAGFFLFGQGQKFSEEKISLKIEAPEKIISGEEITYTVHLDNEGGQTLNDVSLSLFFPEGFTLISADPLPAAPDKKEWLFDALTKGQNRAVAIKGRLMGEAGSSFSLRAFLNFKPAGLNAEFQKVATAVSQFSAPPLEMTWTGPEEITAGAGGEFTLSLLNAGDKDLNNLELALDLPPEFKITAAEPKPEKERLWTISTLKPQLALAFKLTVLPASSITADSETFKAKIFFKEANHSFKQQEAEKIIKIIKADLKLSLTANGTDEKQAVNFGDKVNFAIVLENTGNTVLKNLALRFVLDTPSADNKSLFDWSALEDKRDGAVSGEQISPQIRRAVILWNKNQIPALKEIKPGDKIQVELGLPLKQKNALNLAKLSEYKTTAYAEINGIQGNSLLLILNSDLNVSAQAALKEDKDLPPQIGGRYDSKTVYSLTWTLTNSLHELTDLQLTATLPENVDWEDTFSASAGEIKFDETAKQVSWKLNRLPVSAPKIAVSFDLGLKFKDSEKGQEASLIEKTRIEAKDKATEENLLFFKDPILTIF
ncbi:MAG: hypothetical protein HY982_02390 [Candidatus Magasanikbacteria bacterium]|nr:hypothetical protein [Candidatus Magasanikbacteria bacterium]